MSCNFPITKLAIEKPEVNQRIILKEKAICCIV